MGLVCVFSGVLSSFLPETLNENLPQNVAEARLLGADQKYFSLARTKQKPTDVDNNALEKPN